MNWLELWIQTPIAKALAFTLLHSLWEGAAVAVVFAAALCGLRSPRARYAAACLALLAVLGCFAGTLLALWPASIAHGYSHGSIPAAPAIADAPAAPADHTFRMADLLPWIAPFWILGVAAFHLRSLAGWLAARRMRRSGVCTTSPEWVARARALAARLRVSRPVTLLESSLADAPVVIGYLRPVILMPAGLLAGMPASQIEAILAHELAHVLRRDYLVNLAQTLVEGLLFYHPAVWWISHIIRCEREHCCDDIAVAVSGDRRQYAVALAALEESRSAAHELALAATGGSLMNRIRRILQTPERSRAGLAPFAAASALALVTAVGLAAWPKPAPAAQTAPQGVRTPLVVVTPQGPQNSVPLNSRQREGLGRDHLLAQQTYGDQQKRLVLVQEQFHLFQELQGQVEQEIAAYVQKDLESRAQKKSELTTPYRKWLNEDVAYIITDQERAAFKALTTDGERESFITDFWQRRNPTPGSSENPFREEHYRRIAYANEHFASGIPGWKTDRGRIYISYGPPDEIEDHGAGTYRVPPEQGGNTIETVPFQQWRYKHIDGIGDNIVVEFIDPDGTHEYRMTMDPAEKNAALQKAPGSGNSFVSVGADPQVTINVTGRTVTVRLEQNAIAGQWDYVMTVVSDGKTVATFHGARNLPDSASTAGGRFGHRASFTLDPGSYTFNLQVKDPKGAMQSKSVNFYVN
jgi:GWxTD domain-containing protein